MNKKIKRTLLGILTAATIAGTYSAREGDLPPIYSHKTGDCYGINFSLITEIDEGATINGANISFATVQEGTVNGLNFSIFSGLGDVPNSFSKYFGKTNGIDIGFLINRNRETVNGLQASVFYNQTKKLNGVQIGIFNQAQNNSIILNAGLEE